MTRKEEKELFNKLGELTPDWTGGTLIYVPVFGQLVAVFVGSAEGAIDFLEKDGKGDEITAQLRLDPVEAAGQTLYAHGMALILLQRLWTGVDDTVLAHECLHVANRMLRDRGIEPDPNAEMLAWIQQYLVKAIKWMFSTGNFLTIKDGKRSLPLQAPSMENMIFPG